MYNYPNKKKNLSNSSSKLFIGNKRGLSFEEEINEANDYYVLKDIAHIYKKPTPIKVLKVKSYTNNFSKKIKITDAFFEKKSTTDYNGIYKGKYIDFEAKETQNKTFNLKYNLHEHQKEHLKSVHRHGGIAFLIIKLNYFNEIYILQINKINEEEVVSREFLQNNGYIVTSNTLHLDYLKVIDILMEEKNFYE